MLTKMDATDITDAIFTSNATNCAGYANKYTSQVKDVNEKTDYSGYLKISLKNEQCLFSINAIQIMILMMEIKHSVILYLNKILLKLFNNHRLLIPS